MIDLLINIAFVLLSLAAAFFMVRLFLGPTVPDRVIALDGLLVTILAGVMLTAASNDSAVAFVTVLVVALLGFIGTGIVARYIEQKGG